MKRPSRFAAPLLAGFSFLALIPAAAPAEPIPADFRPRLEWMIRDYRYSAVEAAAAFGVPLAQAEEWMRDFKPASGPAQNPGRARPARVLPYPGGRHPRIGFLEGAVDPRRETKLGIFPVSPKEAGYAVLDLPEAVFAGKDLLFLAHKHIPTVWEARGGEVVFRDWRAEPGGSWRNEWTLPNGLRIASRAKPSPEGMDFEIELTNGGAAPLRDLRVQLCLMLKGAPDFNAQTKENKREFPNVCAASSPDGRRWAIISCEHSRTWQNPPVPCVHADPQWALCEPGETVRAKGRVIFIETPDPEREFEALRSGGRLFESEPGPGDAR